MVEFSTMNFNNKNKNNKTSFTRIKAVDQNYPLYGEVIYEPIGSLENFEQN